MGLSPKLKLPYPEPADPADAPVDMQELAVALDGILAAPGASLPSTPVNGTRALYSPSAGVVWDLLYDGARWSYLGGAPAGAQVATLEATTSLTFVDITTPGPQVTVPLTGDYWVQFGAQVGGPAAEAGRVAVKIGAAAAANADEVYGAYSANGGNGLYRSMLKTALAAGTILKLQYRTTAGGSINFSNRVITIVPARL